VTRTLSRLVLVRHCESAGQAPEAPLTEAGRRQAADLAERLAPLGIDRVVSSPYLRARETIAPFAARAGLAIGTDERLAERVLSPGPVDHWRECVARSFEDPDHRLPGGESGRAVLARGWAAVVAALDGGHRLPVVVSHGQLLALVLHSIDPSFGFRGWESLRNPDVFLLERRTDASLAFARA
jgi:2,3-bisphosphoglycerate-dependent phosphoglycerate mutase